MMDLSIKYLGYTLKNPIIIGSSGLTNSVHKIQKLAENNAGAIVLKSLFEEQLEQDANHQEIDYGIPEAYDYIKEYSKTFGVDKYLTLIEEATKTVDIPIFASINATRKDSWIDFAKKIEQAGAKGLELNIGILPADINLTGDQLIKLHLDIIREVRKNINIPIAVKISSYVGAIGHLVKEIAWSKAADSIIMFNRFYNPDIDLNKMEITASKVLSQAEDPMPSLRWIALLSEKFDNLNFVASTGIYTGEDLFKQLLVGADAVQIVSAIYKHGENYINTMIEQLKTLMKQHNYDKISDFKGKMSLSKLKNPNVFERIQFLKYYGTYE